MRGVSLMAEMDIEQVVAKLTEKFAAGHRLVFWYDDEGEFKDSLVELSDAMRGVATVIELTMGHQLAVKLQLLEAAPSEKFVVYSPQGQPALEENHLRDMVLYSTTFKADTQEILRQELGLPENLHYFLKTHAAFFGSKARRERFGRYDVNSYQEQPELAIMATITRLDQPLVDFFSILRNVLKAGIVDNQYLQLFAKYGVINEFWKKVNQEFSFESSLDSLQLQDLCAALYVTMAFRQMMLVVPAKADRLDLSQKAANVQTFMQQFSASVAIDKQDEYANIAELVWENIDHLSLFKNVKIDDIAKSDVFEAFDNQLLTWLQAQLGLDVAEVKLNGLEIDQFTKYRRETHYGRTKLYTHLYQMMCSAWRLKRMTLIGPAETMQKLIDNYLQESYLIDTDYRHFVYDYQQAKLPEAYRPIRQLVEKWYGKYLSDYGNAWNTHFDYRNLAPQQLQRNFYKQYVGTQDNRIVVIISDSFRFEVAKELQAEFSQDAQVADLKMHYMITGLPSVTYMGMPALLPHKKLDLEIAKHQVLVDGRSAADVRQRQEVLQNSNPRSAAYRYQDLKGTSRDEFREAFANRDVIYIYHNNIDTVGENKGTEDQTFKAAADAIDELRQLVGRLRTNSINHIYITADHGYLYRDAKVTDVNKIDVPITEDDLKSSRYIVTGRKFDEKGVQRQSLAIILNDDDSRYVYYPTAANVFRASGGNNYVHGGSSLQEMIVPLLEVRTSKDKSTAQLAKLQLTNTNRRITSLNTPINVMQPEAISATVRPASYKLYFVTENDRQISGQVVINANNTDSDIGKRIQTIQMTLIDQDYDRNAKYYLIIENLNDGSQQRIQYAMDIVNLRDI